jgi:uncharacterized membrane protein YhaH (DUF805 family)
VDWRHLFTGIEGRISRKPFWIAILILMVVSVPLQFAGLALGGEVLGLLVSFAFVYPAFAVNVKRAHDRNRPTWVIGAYYLLLILMLLMQLSGNDMEAGEPSTPFLAIGSLFLLASFVLLIDLGFLRGTRGPNDYGPDPLEGA